MVVLDCTKLVEDRNASLVFLAFVGHADAADVEYNVVDTKNVVESSIDIEWTQWLQPDYIRDDNGLRSSLKIPL